MGKKVNWTNEASAWVEKIYHSVMADKPEAAERLVEEIYHKTDVLEDFPEIGYRLLDYPHRHVRVLLYGHYRIVYVIKKNDRIDVLGVFHGALDFKRYLQIDDDE